MTNTCSTCKYNERWEDDFDSSTSMGDGKRVGYRCTNADSPVIATVVERESNSNMKEETCHIHTFGCTLWEAKSE